MNNRIKAVIFDVGRVLTLSSKKQTTVHEDIAKSLRISVDKWIDVMDKPYVLSMEGKIKEEKSMDMISKNLHVNKQKLKKIIINVYRKNFYPNKELYNFAFNLKKQGYKIAILSDQWHISKKAVILPELIKKFDVTFLSCDVGIRKPDLRAYKLVAKRLKVKLKEVIFVDDRIWNTQPARKLGMKIILFKNNKQFFKDIKKFNL